MKHVAVLVILPTLLTFFALTSVRAATPQLTADQQAKVNDALKLNSQMQQLAGLGKYSEALALAEKILAVQKEVYGLKNANTAVALKSMGFVLQEKGDFAAARPYFEQSLEIRREVLGAKDVATAQSLNNLGLVLQKLGDREAALKNLEEAYNIYNEVQGPKHLDTASALNNLGFLYQEMGDYSAARPYYEKALAIRKEVAGAESLITAQSLGNLGGLKMVTGDFSAAKPLVDQALVIIKKIRGPRHPDTAAFLNQLAYVQQMTEDYDRAKKNYLEALAIQIDVLGRKHPATAQSYSCLGFFYEDRGDFESAKKCLVDALAINLEFRPGLPDTARAHNNLAVLLMEMGEQADARSHYEQALAIYQDFYRGAVGKQHPDVAKSLGNLATFEANQGNWRAAGQRELESRKIIREHVTNVLPSFSQQQQLLFIKDADRKKLNAALTFGLHENEYEPLAALSAEFLANGKAVIQESLAEQTRQRLESSDPTIQGIIHDLTRARTHLATLAQITPKPGDTDSYRAQLRKAENDEHELSMRVNASMNRAANADSWTSLDQIRKCIPENALLVDIMRIEPRNYNYNSTDKETKPKFQSAHYVAWLTPPLGDQSVQVIDLGPAVKIDTAVLNYQNVFRDCQSSDIKKNPLAILGEQKAEKLLSTSLAAVGQLILDPLMSRIKDKSEIILSPDANLWLIPWAALPTPGKAGEYAIEKWNIYYVISARELVLHGSPNKATKGPAIMADPNYDLDPTRPGNRELFTPASLSLNRGIQTRALSALSIPKVPRLPGTLTEAESIRPTLENWTKGKASVVTGDPATETMFKRIKSPLVLVLSTHGFFFPDQEQAGDKDRSGLSGERESKLQTIDSRGNPLENPLLRCGLLFAGVNNRQLIPEKSELDDGILTGMEIVGADLRGTELVVLSACETGLGQVRNGEGVAGLRQSFQLAGAKSVVATLWQIPDVQSSLLMNDFFTNLAAGQSKSEALRGAQLKHIAARREKFGAAHPMFWAAFTLTGQ